MNTKKIITGLSLASFLGCIDLTGTSTILPSIQIDLQVPMQALQWVNSIVFIALACSTAMIGKLSDIYGKKNILLIGMLAIVIGSIGAGLSTSIILLILFRFIQGLAISVFYTIPIAFLDELLPKEQVQRSTGIIIAANGIGLAIGPVIGGVISEYLGWQWLFYINIPIIAVSFILCKGIQTKRTYTLKSPLSIPKCLLFMVLVFGVIVLTNQGLTKNTSQNDLLHTSYFILAILLLLSFYFFDRKSAHPLIHYSAFKKADFSIGIVVNIILAFSYSILLFMIPQYLKKIGGMTDGRIGMLMLTITLMMSFCSYLSGRLLEKGIHPIKMILTGLAFFFLSIVTQQQLGNTINMSLIYMGLAFFGCGWGLILTPSIVCCMSSVSEDKKGSVMGTLVMLHNLGAAISLSCSITIFNIIRTHFLSQYNSGHIPSKNINVDSFVYGYHGLMNVLSFSMAVITMVALVVSAFNIFHLEEKPQSKLAQK